MNRQFWRWAAIGLAVLVIAGCATSRAIRNAERATNSGDYDSAVAYYRQALAREPSRIELRIQLERATRIAGAEHVKRARELEAQDQLSGAMAEYKLAADLDPASTLAASKVVELDRRIKALVEASRPQPRIETLRQQAAQSSPIPRLDPRATVPSTTFNGVAVRDVLKSIGDLTGINVTYDQASGPTLNTLLSQPYSIHVRNTSLEDVLNQVMQANGMTFKIVNSQTIFVYQDQPANRQKYEDQYVQTFYLSHADPTKLVSLIQGTIQVTGGIQPKFTPSESANGIVVRGSAPILALVESLIRSNDRPVPEVMIEAEILEVNRVFIRKLGIDLSQYALGLTFSPELAPPNTASTPNAFPSGPPPFNMNTISRGVSPADFYITSPTALIQLLESNQTTKILAKPQSRGRANEQMRLSLGDSIPLPQTSFQSPVGVGGAQTLPVTQVQYTEVGINLQFTPRVTYQDEIVLEQLVLEKSGLGPFIQVAGQSFPTIVRLRAEGSMRLRDGESNLVAGLLRDDDRKTLRSFPGFTKIPLLRSLFGNSDTQIDQTDVVMIITPHIVRSRELTPEDLKPRFIGTGNNIGGTAPALISLDSIGVNPAADATAGQNVAPGQIQTAPTQPPPAPGLVTTPATAPVTGGVTVTPVRAPAIVPIEAVPSVPPAAPAPPQTPVRIVLTAPTASPDGTLAAGGGPYTVPITIASAPPLSALSLTITFNPVVIKVPTVTQGTFMAQGGVTPTYVPRVDGASGRIDIAFSRPPGGPGAGNNGLLAAIAFLAGSAGTADIVVSGIATSVTGQTVAVDATQLRVMVK